MVKVLKKFFYRKSVRDFLLLLTENISTKGINLILIAILARHLGPTGYGEYSLMNVCIMFLIPFLDFGMENGAVRYSVKYPEYRSSIFGLYIFAKTVVYCLVLGAFFVFPALPQMMLQKAVIGVYIPIIVTGVIIDGYTFIYATFLQSQEKFLQRMSRNIVVFLIRLFAITFALKIGIKSISLLGWLFALAGFPVLLFFSFKMSAFVKAFVSSPIPRQVFAELFKYWKWFFIGSIAVNLLTRLDFFMVARFLDLKEMGLYNAAFQLVSPFSMLSFVFGTVFLPKVSRFTTIDEVKKFVHKSMRFGSAIFLCALFSIFLAKPAVMVLFGAKFTESIPVLQVLLISFSISLWTGMLAPAFYALEKPKYLFGATYLQFGISVCAMPVLIPQFGMFGAAWSNVAAQCGKLLLLGFFIKKFQTV